MIDGLKGMVAELETKGIIITPRIARAFLSVDRADFVLPEYRQQAYWDVALPLISGQTISQPLTVAFMLELLQAMPGQTVLDIGSGSGYTSALLAEIVGSTGRVFAMERLPELEKTGEANISRCGYDNIRMVTGNGAKGWPEYAPFDRILVNAAVREIPSALPEQLKIGGKLVVPRSDSAGNMILVEKIGSDAYREKRFPGFAFVPFVLDATDA